MWRERRSGEMSEFWPEGRNEGYAANSDEVKLIRAQGECLGTESR